MPDLPPRAQVIDISLDGTTLEVSAFGETRRVHTPCLHPGLESFLYDACVESQNWDDALSVWREKTADYTPFLHPAFQGARVVVDSADHQSADDILAWARVLARVGEPGVLTAIVSGSVSISPESDYNTLGSAAAAVIRLRLGLFVGVGIAVKAWSTQVGLEGSWDGESVWVDTPKEAYDYLVEQLTGNDVVVFTGLGRAAVDECLGREVGGDQ